MYVWLGQEQMCSLMLTRPPEAFLSRKGQEPLRNIRGTAVSLWNTLFVPTEGKIEACSFFLLHFRDGASN